MPMRATRRMAMSDDAFRRAVAQFSDQRWRLNNLYWIRDAHGRRVKFAMNPAQAALYEARHTLNLVLKAR